MNKKLFMFVVATAAVAVLLWGELNKTSSNEGTGYKSTREIVGSKIGGPFTLLSEDGAVFTDKELTRPYRLIYFGFTYCPAICPTELAKIIRSFKQLSAEQQEMIDLVFISIDPERDSAEVLKQYTDLFHPRLVGLTGDKDQVDKVLKRYKVYASKVQDDTMSDYTMDHSSFIYLFNNNNEVRAMYRIDDEADFMAIDLAHLVK